MSQKSQFCSAPTACSFPHSVCKDEGSPPLLFVRCLRGSSPPHEEPPSAVCTMCCLSRLGLQHTRGWAVVALCQEKALSLNILLVKNKCLQTLPNSLCLGICHCITVSVKQSSVLRSSGSCGEAGPLEGGCSSQSNLLQG